MSRSMEPDSGPHGQRRSAQGFMPGKLLNHCVSPTTLPFLTVCHTTDQPGSIRRTAVLGGAYRDLVNIPWQPALTWITCMNQLLLLPSRNVSRWRRRRLTGRHMPGLAEAGRRKRSAVRCRIDLARENQRPLSGFSGPQAARQKSQMHVGKYRSDRRRRPGGFVCPQAHTGQIRHCAESDPRNAASYIWEILDDR